MKNETINNAKEKMINSCKVLKKAITIVEWLIFGTAILLIILGLIFTVTLIVLPEAEQKVEFADKFIQASNNFGNKVDEIEENVTSNNGVYMMVSLGQTAMIFGILGAIRKILKDTIDNETPFTEKNIKNMKQLSIKATILWILSSPFIINVGIIFILAIWVMSYIFKYGYQLQIESDETL